MQAPSAGAWMSFGDVVYVATFLCLGLSAIVGVLWKLGAFRRRGGADQRATGALPARSEIKEAIAETQRTQGTVAALGERVSEIETDRASTDDSRRRVEAVEEELKALRLQVAKEYISREDWVPMTSRVLGVLEEHTKLLARLDERSRPGTGD